MNKIVNLIFITVLCAMTPAQCKQFMFINGSDFDAIITIQNPLTNKKLNSFHLSKFISHSPLSDSLLFSIPEAPVKITFSGKLYDIIAGEKIPTIIEMRYFELTPREFKTFDKIFFGNVNVLLESQFGGKKVYKQYKYC